MTQKTACILACVLMMGRAAAGNSEFAGTWDGNENGLPSVELKIQDSASGINGSIGFYFQTRGADGKWHLGEKYTVPLLRPKTEGRVLTFETIHHRKHGSPELGPNNKYRVDFVGVNEARLRILRDQPNKNDSGLKLTRHE